MIHINILEIKTLILTIKLISFLNMINNNARSISSLIQFIYDKEYLLNLFISVISGL